MNALISKFDAKYQTDVAKILENQAKIIDVDRQLGYDDEQTIEEYADYLLNTVPNSDYPQFVRVTTNALERKQRKLAAQNG